MLTALAGTLSATVYDSTATPASGAAVALTVVSAAPAGWNEMVGVRHAEYPAAPWTSIVAGTVQQFRADSTGRLRLSFRLGTVAATIRIELRPVAAGLAAAETLSFVALPGKATRIDPHPRDTAAYVDRTYQLRTQARDAYGNATADSVRFTGDAVATVTAAGVVTGRRIGRALLRVEAATVRDSVWTSVVPRGVLVASRRFPQPALVMFALDGSDLTTIANRAVTSPAWTSGGERLVFTDFSAPLYFTGGRIFIHEFPSDMERPLIADYGENDYQRTPVFSGDDASILFAGRVSLERILRVSIATGAVDTVAIPPPDGTSYGDPAASRNGRFVAYSEFPPCCSPWVVAVKDLQTGTTTKLPQREMPRWLGATDSLVTHVPAGFDILRPDGTRVRGIAYPGVLSSEGITYNPSPDGRWLAVSADISNDAERMIEIVDVSNGMRMPLAFTASFGSPAWRP
ncbi:MAG: hypothetical protein Q8K82_18125 [Gemmatimonadaceae bacterium]|nr:hypothetical protein [Gemmatimonadaceae bacterium]